MSNHNFRAALLCTCAGILASTAATAAVAPELAGAKPTFLVKPPSSYARAAAVASLQFAGTAGVGTTIPFWTSSVTSPLDGKTYTYSMIGSSPYAATPSNTNVTYVPVALRIHIGSVVVDPTAVSHCDTQSSSRRFFNSPFFRPTTFVSNGVNVSTIPGGTQLISAFQRANFWSAVGGTNYGVTLIPSRLDTIVVDWTPKGGVQKPRVLSVADDCGGTINLAEVDINDLDTELNAIATAYSKPNQIPVTLVADTAIYQNRYKNCCILGYHNAVSVAGGTQVYAVGAFYSSTKVFGPDFADTTVWAHELAEMFDDPFVQSIAGAPAGTKNGRTPPWGHTGQVSGCQDNLEAGDPLTPDQVGAYVNYPVTGVGGYVYHYQDLPFHDWFFRTASTSTGGKYSFVGNFTGVQGKCT